MSSLSPGFQFDQMSTNACVQLPLSTAALTYRHDVTSGHFTANLHEFSLWKSVTVSARKSDKTNCDMFVVTVALISRLVSASRPGAAIRSPVSSGAAGFVRGGVVHMQSPPLLKFLSHKIKNKGSKKMNKTE